MNKIILGLIFFMGNFSILNAYTVNYKTQPSSSDGSYNYSITCSSGSKKHIYVYPRKQSFQYVSSKSRSFNSLEEAVSHSCKKDNNDKYRTITDSSILCKGEARIKKIISFSLYALETLGEPKKYNCSIFKGNQKVKIIQEYSNGVTKVKVNGFGTGYVRTSDFK